MSKPKRKSEFVHGLLKLENCRYVRSKNVQQKNWRKQQIEKADKIEEYMKNS